MSFEATSQNVFTKSFRPNGWKRKSFVLARFPNDTRQERKVDTVGFWSQRPIHLSVLAVHLSDHVQLNRFAISQCSKNDRVSISSKWWETIREDFDD